MAVAYRGRPPDALETMKRVHVLVVDDERQFLDLASLALCSAGFLVTTAVTPSRALQLLAGAVADVPPVDVLVTDLAMPELSGAELVDRARQLGVVVPTLVVSGHRTQMDAVRLQRSGVTDYLEKPFSVAAFVTRVQAVASRTDCPTSPVSV
jgi:two-component system, LuxR family, response regulator FixJ